MEIKETDLIQSLNLSQQEGHMPRETNMVKRAIDMLFNSKATWPVIANEAGGLKEVFVPFTIEIALIPALAGAVLRTLIWGSLFALMGGETSMGLFSRFLFAGVSYAYGMAALLVVGKVVEILAPNWNLKRSWVMACRVLVYGSTPVFLSQALSGIPFVNILIEIVAYSWSFILMKEGYQVLLKKPQSQQPQAPQETPKSDTVLIKA